ncbi:MAG: aminopeptidase [Anaerolineaceae bacterium]|nr:MAG: aminopeptidase [Anaerolineaceae bacterium]
MATKFEQNLQKYAELAVRVGLNLRPGQRLLVRAPSPYGVAFEHAPLVRYVAEAAYKAGARLVDVFWGDEQMELIRFAHAPRDSFAEFPKWKLAIPLEYAEHGDAILTISATDPSLLSGQDPELVNTYQDTVWKEMNPYLKHGSSNSMNWCVISAARLSWAKKMFPKLTAEKALAKQWQTIFKMCRVDADDPVAAWKDHIRNLQTRSKYLNQKQYSALHYTAPGTDLTLGLPKGHHWASAREVAKNGIEFTANLPTEETFTMADRTRADGIVTSTKTLNYSGTLIEGIVVRFENGRVVESHASKNESALRKMIATDEGSARLGEIAIVPHSSPISKSGLMFHNTLFDENASCHIALGRAYKFNMQGGLELTDEEFAARGGNQSLIHVDFMIGSDKMDIDGITSDGRAEPVLRKGEWAFSV